MKILVVDDNKRIRQGLKQLIAENPGWAVCGEADDGGEGIALAARLQPNLIIMDLAMPTVDGIRASVEILKSSPRTPIVLYTMHSSEQLTLEAKKAGIREVVTKTESGEVLIKIMEKYLKEDKTDGIGGDPLSQVAAVNVAGPVAAGPGAGTGSLAELQTESPDAATANGGPECN